MDAMKFGSFIAEIRKEKGFTQKHLAELLHVSDKTISKWECGQGFPSIDLLEPLASALDLSLIELMKSERLAQDAMTVAEASNIVEDYLQGQKKKSSLAADLFVFLIRLLALTVTLFFLLTGFFYVIGQLFSLNLFVFPVLLPSIYLAGVAGLFLEQELSKK